MRTASVVVGHPCAQDPAQVTFVDGNQPVQTFPPDRPITRSQNALACGVRTGVFKTRSPIDRIAQSTAGA